MAYLLFLFLLHFIYQSLKDEPPKDYLTSESNLTGVNPLVTSPMLYQFNYRKNMLLNIPCFWV